MLTPKPRKIQYEANETLSLRAPHLQGFLPRLWEGQQQYTYKHLFLLNLPSAV